jgi:hypothetical protein
MSRKMLLQLSHLLILMQWRLRIEVKKRVKNRGGEV